MLNLEGRILQSRYRIEELNDQGGMAEDLEFVCRFCCEATPLSDGDVIRIGEVELQFRVG
jgi:hypothetical protein